MYDDILSKLEEVLKRQLEDFKNEFVLVYEEREALAVRVATEAAEKVAAAATVAAAKVTMTAAAQAAAHAADQVATAAKIAAEKITTGVSMTELDREAADREAARVRAEAAEAIAVLKKGLECDGSQ